MALTIFILALICVVLITFICHVIKGYEYLYIENENNKEIIEKQRKTINELLKT